MQEEIIKTLTGDADLTALLGKTAAADGTLTETPAVFAAVPPSWEGLPAISVRETLRQDVAYADDEPLAFEGRFEVQIYAEGEPETVFGMVNRLMQGIGFRLQEASVSCEPSMIVKSCVYSRVDYYM